MAHIKLRHKGRVTPHRGVDSHLYAVAHRHIHIFSGTLLYRQNILLLILDWEVPVVSNMLAPK